MSQSPRKRMEEQGISGYLLIPVLLFLALVPATVPLLGIDDVPFLKEYLMVFLMGAGFYPVTGSLFSEYKDRGWLFSKGIGLLFVGTILAAGSSFQLFQADFAVCMGVLLVFVLLCQMYGLISRTGRTIYYPLIFWEEVLFFAFFLLWTYLSGFHPEAYDADKFVQLGVFSSMQKSGTFAISDLWYQGGKSPAAFAGLWYGVVLSKLSGVEAQEGFNLYHAFLSALTFTMPFCLVYHLLWEKMRLRGEVQRLKRDLVIPVLGGTCAGLAASMAGNLHYLVYGLILPFFDRTRDYWFPDSTRYIGYQSELALDQTIHEFPAYDFVIGDLSQNVSSLLFSWLLLGLALSILMKDQERVRRRYHSYRKAVLLNPAVFAYGAVAGLLLVVHPVIWPLYLCLFGITILTGCITLLPKASGTRRGLSLLTALISRILEALLAGGVTALCLLPFVKMPKVSLAFAAYHSGPGPLFLLWGLPLCLFLATMAAILLRWKKMGVSGKGRFFRFFTEILTPDHFFLMLGAFFLLAILIPEMVYLRDVYEKGYPRAYTMKYFAWEASLAGALLTGYGIGRLLSWKKEPILKQIGAIGAVVLLCCCGYFFHASSSWYGSVTRLSDYRGLDASAYIRTVFPEDAAAIRWLKEETAEPVVLLEPDGESYSFQCRYSALTGNTIPLGWHIHERSWGRSKEDVELRAFDVRTMYTSKDAEEIRDLLSYYEVRYVIINPLARRTYGQDLSEDLLASLGTLVYEDAAVKIYDLGESGT